MQEDIGYWYHVTSKDLATFRNEGIKIRPAATKHDDYGACSGSAFVIGDRIHFLYWKTLADNGERVSCQMHALVNNALKVRNSTFASR